MLMPSGRVCLERRTLLTLRWMEGKTANWLRTESMSCGACRKQNAASVVFQEDPPSLAGTVGPVTWQTGWPQSPKMCPNMLKVRGLEPSGI